MIRNILYRRGRGNFFSPPIVIPPDPPVVDPTLYDWNGVSATLAQESNGVRFTSKLSAPTNRDYIVAGSETSGNKLHITKNYNNFTHRRWLGGKADIYRITNGSFISVGSFYITGGNFYIPFLVTRDIITGTSYTHTHPSWSKPGVTYYYTIEAEGNKQYVAVSVDSNWQCNVTWNEVPGATEYKLYYSDVPPEEQTDFTHLVVDGEVLPGDQVFIKNTIYQPSEDMIMNRIYNTNETGSIEWGLHRGKLNRADYSYRYTDTSAIFTLGDNIEKRLFGLYWHSRPEEQWYETLKVGDTYRFRFKARTTGKVRVRFDFFIEGVTNPSPIVIDNNEWQEYTFEVLFSQQRTAANIAYWNFNVTNQEGIPADIEISSVVMENTKEPYNQIKQSISDQTVEGMFLRDHNLIKDAKSSHSLQDIFRNEKASLFSFLNNCKLTKTNPWIQLEWYWTAEEYQDIMAYLGAPVSSGHWAALLRAEMGQVEPWTEVFDQIYYEFGNESWNSLSDFWTAQNGIDSATGVNIPRSTVFGLFCKMGADAMESSPYFSNKIKWVIGGWSRFSYGVEAALVFDKEVFVGVANYNGGWDEGNVLLQDTPEHYRILLTTPYNNLRLQSIFNLNQQVAPYPKMKPICYEAGPGYQLNGLNGAKVTPQQKINQETIMKSVAAATATLETFLWQSVYEFDQCNFFVLGDRGDNWQSMSPEGNVFPTWKVCRILHSEFGKGVVEPIDTNNPDLWAFKVTNKINEGIIIGNRSITETLTLNIDLSEYNYVYTYSGNYDDYNRYIEGKQITPSNTYIDDTRSKTIDITKMTAATSDKIDIKPGLFKIFTQV